MSQKVCGIVHDLLPLYIDQISTKESTQFIDDHLTHCDSCREQLQQLQSQLTYSKPAYEEDLTLLKDATRTVKAFRKMSFWKGSLLALIICICLGGLYWGLFQWEVVEIKAELTEISDVQHVGEGLISYHLKITDGREVSKLQTSSDGFGNVYIVGYRPIIAKKIKPSSNQVEPVGLHNTKLEFNQYDYIRFTIPDMTLTPAEALYYGTEENHKLIWSNELDL